MDTAVVRYIKKLNFKNKTLSFSLLKELCPDNGDYNSSCTSSACQCGKNRGLLCQNGRCLYKKKILFKTILENLILRCNQNSTFWNAADGTCGIKLICFPFFLFF